MFALAMVYAPDRGRVRRRARASPCSTSGSSTRSSPTRGGSRSADRSGSASYSTADFGATQLGVKRVAVFYLDAGAANYSRAVRRGGREGLGGLRRRGAGAGAVRRPTRRRAPTPSARRATPASTSSSSRSTPAKVINCGVEAQIQGYKPPKGWGGYLIGVPGHPRGARRLLDRHVRLRRLRRQLRRARLQGAVQQVSSKTETYSSVTVSYFISALLMRDAIAKLGDNITRDRLRDVLNTFTDWTPGPHQRPEPADRGRGRRSCHVALEGGYVIQIQKARRQAEVDADHATVHDHPAAARASAPRRVRRLRDIFSR